MNVILEEYDRIFKKAWSPLTAGMLLGMLNLFMFLYARPWGVFDGARNWGEHLLGAMGLLEVERISPLEYSTSITNLGVFGGALIAALLAGKWGLHLVKTRDYGLGLIGGVFMGIGGALAMGCNVGGFFTAFAAFSLAGPLMMIGLFAGAYLGSQVYLLDLEHHPRPPAGHHVKSLLAGATSKRIQPWVGLALLVLLLHWALGDNWNFSYRGVEGKRGILLILALAIGFVLHRAHFCFARAFREPFMTGDAKMTQGAAVALLVGFLGYTLVKTGDLADYRPEDFFVNPSVWIGSLLGGVIFGFGMVLAGGCTSGSLWRAGEGQIRLFMTLFTFSLTAAWMDHKIMPTLRPLLGDKAVYAPELLGLGWAFALFLAIPLLWALWAKYNEKTNFCVIQ